MFKEFCDLKLFRLQTLNAIHLIIKGWNTVLLYAFLKLQFPIFPFQMQNGHRQHWKP